MLKPDRGSLMNLKPSLPKVAPIVATEEMQRQIMGDAQMGHQTPQEVQPAVSMDIRKDVLTERVPVQLRDRVPSLPARKGRREGTILLNAKIPVSLHVRLKRTSQYNDVSMTDILLRGIEAELSSGRYSVPPETWGTD